MKSKDTLPLPGDSQYIALDGNRHSPMLVTPSSTKKCGDFKKQVPWIFTKNGLIG